MPLVSVIMPSYNHERYISEAIESVLNQTFTDFELIIIDDASKDKSKKIIQAYQEKDSRIRAIFHDENKGIAKTLNEGLNKVRGKFIAFIASDDVWIKNKLERQLEILEKNENLIVWSEGEIIDAQGHPTGELFTQRHGASERKKSGDIFEELFKGNYIFGSSMIFKEKNLGNIRFDENLKYLNDYKFVVDLARKYKYYYIPEPLAKYRIHGKNTILSDKESWKKDSIMIGIYFLEKYGDMIPKKVKAKIFLNLGVAYSGVGEKRKAIQHIYRAFKLDPFDSANLRYLSIALTDEDGITRKVLRWIYRKLSRR